MGDLLDFVAYRNKKRIKEAVYGSYESWVSQNFLSSPRLLSSRYDLAVEAQQNGGYYLFKYFYPDFDW